MNFLPGNLRFICKQFGVTQEGLASYMNKTQTTIGNWMMGKAEPKIEELLVLADYFGFDLTTFVATDVENGNLINPEIIENFRLNGNLKGNVKGNLITKKTSKVYDKNPLNSVVNEPDETTSWFLLKELKRLSQEIEQLRVSVDKLSNK